MLCLVTVGCCCSLPEIIHLMLRMAVWIHRHRQACVWPWPSLTRSASPAPPIHQRGFLFFLFFSFYCPHFLQKCLCILARSRRNKISVNVAPVNTHTHTHTPLFQLTSTIDYIMPCSHRCLPHFVAIVRRRARARALAARLDGERSTSAAVRGHGGCHDGLLCCNSKPRDLNPAFKHPCETQCKGLDYIQSHIQRADSHFPAEQPAWASHSHSETTVTFISLI